MRIPATLLLLFSLFLVSIARCQSPELIIQGQTGKLFLEHTVVAKENWYSIGRLFNISPKVLAPYNHRTLAKSLTIGQTLEIPLTATNFSQNGLKTSAETLVPVFHIVREKEWMYRISVNHNKVPIPSLEKWNHITGDQLHPGLHLIVGFLKVKTVLSALATSTPAPVAAAPIPAARVPATPVPAAPVPAVPIPPVTPPVHASAAASNDVSAAATKTNYPAVNPLPNAPHFEGGVFRSEFSDEGHSADGQAGVFKSTSGWQDGKYYALMNNVTIGTIVRVTDPASGKSVYTKVLGQLPDMKESAGLAIRISNAAAAELGQAEGRLAVKVIYYRQTDSHSKSH